MFHYTMYKMNPLKCMGGGHSTPQPPAVFFALKAKHSKGNPYLKSLDFFQHFVADAPMKKKDLGYYFVMLVM